MRVCISTHMHGCFTCARPMMQYMYVSMHTCMYSCIRRHVLYECVFYTWVRKHTHETNISKKIHLHAMHFNLWRVQHAPTYTHTYKSAQQMPIYNGNEMLRQPRTHQDLQMYSNIQIYAEYSNVFQIFASGSSNVFEYSNLCGIFKCISNIQIRTLTERQTKMS
jgi:hypothetical protein